MSTIRRIPVGDARELPPDEAWRELYATFGWTDQPTMPAPLEFPPIDIGDDDADHE